MAKALTPTQRNYLQWLKQENSIAVCIEFSNQLGEIAYSSTFSFKSDIRALHNLKRYGFIQEKDTFEYGLRWTVITISKQGEKALEAETCL